MNLYNLDMPTTLQIPSEIDLPQFISKEAHDLKSPFNRILGFLKLVLKGMDGPISDQARDDLSTAHNNSQYATVLMSGLIEMARLSRGEKNLTLEECDLEHLLGQISGDWKRQYSNGKMADVVISAPGLQIKVDEVEFRRCILHWVSYVGEFVLDGASITIQVEELPQACSFIIRSSGKKVKQPPECDLTMYGYIASRILEMHRGMLQRAEEDEQGALVQFIVPKGQD